MTLAVPEDCVSPEKLPGAVALGVPIGLLMGWSRTFKDYTFPILEVLRPIPILAWVPLAILMVAYTLFGLWLLSTPAAG